MGPRWVVHSDMVRKTAWELYMTVLGLLISLLIPVMLIFFIPTLIWRPIAKALRPYLRPDLDEMLSCSSSVFAQVDDDDYVKSMIVMHGSLKGVLDYDLFVQQVKERLLDCKEEESGDLRYPQLKQYITNWVGYKFWKWEEDFHVKNHVHLINENNLEMRPDDLLTISKNLLCGTFEARRSPWDMTLIPGVMLNGELSTFLIIRSHHALADGYSLLFLVQRLFGESRPRAPLTPKCTSLEIGYFLRLPYKVLRIFGELAHNTASSFLWKIPETQKSREWSIYQGDRVKVTSIIKIKRHFGVSFTAVVFSLLCGGLQRFIARHGKGPGIRALPSAITVPVKSHPDKLCNKFSFAMFSYPVGVQDPVERLSTVHNNFEDLRDSPVPIIGYFAFRLHGSHFNCVGKLINSYRYAPFVTSYFPTGQPNWVLQDCPVDYMTFFLRVQQGQQGAMLCVSAFHNSISLNAVFNASLLSQEEVIELGRDIEEEAEILLEAIEFHEKKVL